MPLFFVDTIFFLSASTQRIVKKFNLVFCQRAVNRVKNVTLGGVGLIRGVGGGVKLTNQIRMFNSILEWKIEVEIINFYPKMKTSLFVCSLNILF